MKLRDYQQASVDAIYDYLREYDGNPLVVNPVGAGKSLVIAKIATDAVQRWQGRVLIITHSAELVEQNADKLQRFCPDLNVGVYCAGLKSRSTDTSVVCASIHSVYKKACDLGPFDLIIVDECHAISPDGESMYGTFLAEARIVNPNVRLVGLTGTPFRLSSGPICHEDGLFQDICYEVGLKELIDRGYLSPLVSKASRIKIDTSELRKRAGEFVSGDAEELMNANGVVEAACDEIVELTKERTACLIFAAGVDHARHIVDVLHQRHGIECGFVSASTTAAERAETLTRFRDDRSGELFPKPPLKYLANYGILTTGFDAPRVDCIALLRPTASPGLLTQMVGRGTRLSPGKADCLILDYGNNLVRHGPIDKIKPPTQKANKGNQEPPGKECPECHTVVAAGYATCPDCGHEFPPPERTSHDAQASFASVLSGEVTETEFEVLDIMYRVHTKRSADEDAPRTLRVDYRLGLDHWQSEWVCVEHSGYARRKAEAWWQARSNEPVPDNAEIAADIGNAGGLAWAEQITVREVSGEPYARIVDYQLGEISEAVELASNEIPF